MCSITEQVQGKAAVIPTVPASTLSVLAAHAHEVADLVAELLRSPGVAGGSEAHAEAAGRVGSVDLGGLHPDVAAELATTLLAVADRATAAATVLAGQVVASTGPGTGCLIAGRFASPRRWLEVQAGLAPAHAKAVLARGRDLREHSMRVEDAWLAGTVSGDAVRELTSGVSGALKVQPASAVDKQRMRAEALDLLLPLATVGTPADVHKAVDRLRFTLEPEATASAAAAIATYDEQTLTVSVLGPLTRITAWLTHENAAAALTVLDQNARRIADEDRPVVHDTDCIGEAECTCGARAKAGAVSRNRWSHLLAVAFGETMTTLLDNGLVGSHHGITPHVTVTADLDLYLYLTALTAGGSTAGTLIGELTMPGHDQPVLLPDASVRRILCDADLTRILTTGRNAGRPRDVTSRLLTASRSVLYVGRAHRTVTPRQRRALEARDQHCVFPDCRAHVRRCHAHHVDHWEDGGPTDLSNLALLCVAHHHAVHEGGWTLQLRPGNAGHETDCWQAHPPGPPP